MALHRCTGAGGPSPGTAPVPPTAPASRDTPRERERQTEQLLLAWFLLSARVYPTLFIYLLDISTCHGTKRNGGRRVFVGRCVEKTEGRESIEESE